eukprot:NODE_134_length_16603_cov_0.784052.p11 type:complete len:191 gc:universal NODE_134_length_16603_cov_0.784052:5019-5591(+)
MDKNKEIVFRSKLKLNGDIKAHTLPKTRSFQSKIVPDFVTMSLEQLQGYCTSNNQLTTLPKSPDTYFKIEFYLGTPHIIHVYWIDKVFHLKVDQEQLHFCFSGPETAAIEIINQIRELVQQSTNDWKQQSSESDLKMKIRILSNPNQNEHDLTYKMGNEDSAVDAIAMHLSIYSKALSWNEHSLNSAETE